MTLTVDEIIALSLLAATSGEQWFSIRAYNYIWDRDNKVRMKVEEAVNELFQCADSFIPSLPSREKETIILLKERMKKDNFDFENFI